MPDSVATIIKTSGRKGRLEFCGAEGYELREDDFDSLFANAAPRKVIVLCKPESEKDIVARSSSWARCFKIQDNGFLKGFVCVWTARRK
jgi:hypothetical protein